MRQSACLTLGILKSIYPQADLDVAGDGFAVTCSDEGAHKLVEDSAVAASRYVRKTCPLVNVILKCFNHSPLCNYIIMSDFFINIRYATHKL
jgi:hypothetical protein